MTSPGIEVNGLSKRYRLGERLRYRTLRDALAKKWREGWRRLRTPGDAPPDPAELWALHDVSFRVEHGEVVGVIGRNGAGKSTLLKILSRITPPTEGRVVLRGRVGSLLEVGTGFHPELTGRENIFLNGAILGMKQAEIRRKFDEIVAFAEIDKFIDTPVKRYSSGMYVRLAFSIAAHLEPEILLVDEVLAVGDIQFQRKCMGKMSDAAREEGRTVLFVSHNMPAVERLCNRCLLLRDGRLAQEGPPPEVIASYLQADQSPHTEWRREGPPPDHAHLRRIALLNADGTPARVITTRSALVLEIECAVPRPQPFLRLAACVFGPNEQAIFSTNPMDDGRPFPAEPGLHTYRARFPAELFMPQRYTITISLYANRQSVDNCPHAIRFDVTPVASLANLAGDGRPGLVQMACRWTCETRPLDNPEARS